MKNGFTLVEILMVVLIAGILAAIALLQFAPTKEGALDREAKANLKLVYAAEKIYRTEMNFYVNAANTTTVNDILKLSIPSGSGASWNYKVVDGAATTFTGKAQRVTDSRVWCINQSTDEPYQSGCAW